MSVKINDTTFPAIYLKTPEDIERGMMHKKSLKGCMVFKLSRGFHSFWMKNCIIPLDIVFVSGDKISKIHTNCQPCDENCEERFTGYGDHVIEFPGNTAKNWKIGDSVKMYLGSPMNPLKK